MSLTTIMIIYTIGYLLTAVSFVIAYILDHQSEKTYLRYCCFVMVLSIAWPLVLLLIISYISAACLYVEEDKER